MGLLAGRQRVAGLGVFELAERHRLAGTRRPALLASLAEELEGAGHPAGRPDRSRVAAAPEARGSGAGRGGGAHDQGTYPEIRRPEVACQEARGGEAGSQEGAGGLGSEEICRIDNVGEETDRQEARGDHVRCQEADREEVDREEVRGEATREDGGVICRWP